MTLSEYRQRYGIKRIDFSKLKRSEIEEQYGSDKLICPYCMNPIEYEGEEIDDIISGEPYQCPKCEMWFYAEGELSLETTCIPMENAVIDRRKHIEDSYAHLDKCEAGGVDFKENRFGNIEWNTYASFARPLLENLLKGKRYD